MVIQALREQSGMSTPDSRGAVDSGCADHLLSEQIDQHQGCVALRAVTAQSDGTIKEMAIWAGALADVGGHEILKAGGQRPERWRP